MRRLRHRRNERGSAVVEAAIVLPTIIMVLFGMLEMGLYFKDTLTLSEATKDGARTGAQWAQDPGADYYILQAIKKASLSGNILEVIVYDAAPADPTNQSAQAPSAACQSSSNGVSVTYTDSGGISHPTGAIGSCNVYVAANGDFNHPLADFLGTGQTFTNAGHWPGAQRLQNTTDTRYTTSGQTYPGPDQIGVWVKTTHYWATGFIATTPTSITDQSVFRIEPRQ